MLKFAASILALALAASAARAAEGCEACRADDEQQIGAHVEPDVSVPPVTEKPDLRGQEIKVPLPGVDARVRINPREGLWLGSPGEGKGNLYLKGDKEKASVGYRLGF